MKTSYTPARFAVLAWLALSVCQSQAQIPIPALAPVVVTATRTATPITEQISEITLFSRQDIERSGAQSLTQLLSQSMGLQASPESVRGASASVFIRGSNNNHALVLVDGQRVSSATVGATAIAHLPLEQVDRVEVLRGSASSLYGADALGGVVQIFTRRGERVPSPDAALTLGSYGTRAASVSYGGKVDGSRFRISLGREVSSGFSDIKAAKGGYYDSFNPDRDGYQQSNMALSLSQLLSPQLELGASYWTSRSTKRSDNANCDPYDYVGTSCTTAFDNREHQRLEAWQLSAQYRPSPAWTSVLRAGQGKDEMRSWLYNPGIPEVNVSRYATSQQQVVWQNDLRAGPGILMTALERRQTEVNATQKYTLQSQNSDSLVVGYQAWLDKHLLQASVRKDWVSAFDNQSTHSLGYGYKLQPQWLARASVGTGYKVPTFNDLYWPLDRANFYQGNPLLKPERSKNTELGLTFQSEATKASATIYRNVVKDIIVNSYNADIELVKPVNVNSAFLRGLSLQGSQRFASWTFSGVFDALHAKDTGANLYLPRRVPRTASLDVTRSLGAWNYGTQLALFSHRFNDKENLQRLSGYGLLHMKLGYALSPHLRLQADFKNLLNKDYVQSQGLYDPLNVYSVAGRSVFVSLRYAPQ